MRRLGRATIEDVLHWDGVLSRPQWTLGTVVGSYSATPVPVDWNTERIVSIYTQGPDLLTPRLCTDVPVPTTGSLSCLDLSGHIPPPGIVEPRTGSGGHVPTPPPLYVTTRVLSVTPQTRSVSGSNTVPPQRRSVPVLVPLSECPQSVSVPLTHVPWSPSGPCPATPP